MLSTKKELPKMVSLVSKLLYIIAIVSDSYTKTLFLQNMQIAI